VQAYLLLIMAAAVIAVSAATVYGFAWSSSKAQSEATRRMTLQSERSAASIATSIAVARSSAEGLAAQPGLAAGLRKQAPCQLSAEGTESFSKIRIDIVAPGGRVLCSSDPSLPARGSVHKGSGWLGASLRKPSTLVDAHATDAVTRAPALVIAHSVPGPRGPQATVAVLVHLPGTAATLARNFAGIQHAGLSVVERATGAVVSTSDLPADRPYRVRFGHSQATGKWVGLGGTRRLYGSADVRGTGWRVYSGVPSATVLADARGTLTRQVWVGILTLLILAFAAWLLNRRVAGPLRAIATAVARVGREPDAKRLGETGTAEIAALGRAFNTMLDLRAGQEAQLVYQASHDPLTGLPNRMVLREQLDEAVRSDPQAITAVLWFGVDRLDIVNDSFGHDVGDSVLVAVASRLSATLRPSDTLAHFGGEEFVVLSEHLCAGESVELAKRLHRCLEEPFRGPDGDIVIHGSIGIAEADGSASNPEQLLRQADSAMREARRTSRNFCRFDRGLQDRATQHLKMEHDLWQALKRDEFVVHYQPVMDLSSGRIVGAEALVRWCHPDRGMIPPLDFIPVAEQTGQIVPIGHVVLERACRQAAAWRAAGHPLRISVNVAVAQLLDDGFVADVAAILSETGLRPEHLCLEVTESSLLSAGGLGTAGIEELRRLGVRISIDDFGTGYSSLSYLHQMPVDELKIDRSFISRLGNDVRDRHLVTAILGMARALDLTVVAEGVETEEQRELLAGFHCSLAQGYLFSAPQPAEGFVALLEAQPTPLRPLVAA
jgi:diguanylate cyclase (GGDEF)-like protein